MENTEKAGERKVITQRHLKILNSAGVGVGPYDVEEWADAITASCAAGVLRIGDYSACLIDKVLQAWVSKSFANFPVYEYTYGDHPTPWLDADSFRHRAAGAHTFIRLPLGHPVKAEYTNGQVESVYALTFPGEYDTDVTDGLASLFPSGVDKSITAIYAVISSSEEDWTREAWRTHLLLTGERGFISGMDRLTLASVTGVDLQDFCDEGILGALSIPVIEEVTSPEDVDNIVDNVGNSRCVVIAQGDDITCALYCSRVQVGEILGVRVGSGVGSTDEIYLDLDSGDTVTVTDLLAIRNMTEGTEVFYVEDSSGEYVLSDEHGNFLLGS